MKCSYHPGVEAQEACSTCKKPLCGECTHKVKGKPYCEDCLTEGAKWAATARDLRLPSDAPKRAALCALIPGMGAVYNSEYLKAVTYFAVWAALAMMGSRISGVFGFGAFVFIIFTMFDAYRTAEHKAHMRLESGVDSNTPAKQDKAVISWGIFLIILGILFLLQNVIPYQFLYHLWPLLFVALGVYLVYHALEQRKERETSAVDVERKTVQGKENV
jgi:hypothetical protein